MAFAFPVSLELGGRRCVVLGGGRVAEHKVLALLEAGADVTVVAPATTGGLQGLAAERRITLLSRPYERGDLHGAFLAIAATDSPEQNAAAFAEAEAERVLFNAVDDVAHCHFAAPSILRRGDLTLAISTGGRAPALAKRLREHLSALLGPEYAAVVELLSEARQEALETRDVDFPVWAERWARAVSHDLAGLVSQGRAGEARALVRRSLAGEDLHVLHETGTEGMDVSRETGCGGHAPRNNAAAGTEAPLQIGPDGMDRPRDTGPEARHAPHEPGADRMDMLQERPTDGGDARYEIGLGGMYAPDGIGTEGSDVPHERGPGAGDAPQGIGTDGTPNAAGSGQVAIVGAGPGDPGLITVRGKELIDRADVVVHDGLVHPQLYAGKVAIPVDREPGRRGVAQERTSALLVRLARRGKRVVRLKGGDPFVFGRGAEEAEALTRAGVAFEVVPAPSSVVAVPAYAGIPVTDRRLASSVAFVTGHTAGRPVDWPGLARAVDTLVIVMGRDRLPDIVAALLEGGRDPSTPAALIENGTLPGQRVVACTLAELPVAARRHEIGSPSLVVVGDVVRLRQGAAWFSPEARPTPEAMPGPEPAGDREAAATL